MTRKLPGEREADGCPGTRAGCSWSHSGRSEIASARRVPGIKMMSEHKAGGAPILNQLSA